MASPVELRNCQRAIDSEPLAIESGAAVISFGDCSSPILRLARGGPPRGATPAQAERSVPAAASVAGEGPFHREPIAGDGSLESPLQDARP